MELAAETWDNFYVISGLFYGGSSGSEIKFLLVTRQRQREESLWKKWWQDCLQYKSKRTVFRKWHREIKKGPLPFIDTHHKILTTFLLIPGWFFFVRQFLDFALSGIRSGVPLRRSLLLWPLYQPGPPTLCNLNKRLQSLCQETLLLV